MSYRILTPWRGAWGDLRWIEPVIKTLIDEVGKESRVGIYCRYDGEKGNFGALCYLLVLNRWKGAEISNDMDDDERNDIIRDTATYHVLVSTDGVTRFFDPKSFDAVVFLSMFDNSDILHQWISLCKDDGLIMDCSYNHVNFPMPT